MVWQTNLYVFDCQVHEVKNDDSTICDGQALLDIEKQICESPVVWYFVLWRSNSFSLSLDVRTYAYPG
jgi:hypothetical protein